MIYEPKTFWGNWDKKKTYIAAVVAAAIVVILTGILTWRKKSQIPVVPQKAEKTTAEKEKEMQDVIRQQNEEAAKNPLSAEEVEKRQDEMQKIISEENSKAPDLSQEELDKRNI